MQPGLVLALNYSYGLGFRSWIGRLRGKLPAENKASRIVFWSLEAFLQLSFIACIVAGSSAFYVTALVVQLAQAALVFLGLVTSLAENVASE